MFEKSFKKVRKVTLIMVNGEWRRVNILTLSKSIL